MLLITVNLVSRLPFSLVSQFDMEYDGAVIKYFISNYLLKGKIYFRLF